MAEIKNIQAIVEKKFSYPLRYPYESQTDYKGVISFTVLEEEPVNLENVYYRSKDLLIEAGQTVADLITSEEKQANIAATKGKDKNYQSVEKKKPVLTDRSIQLYLPVGLIYRDNVAYENVELGIAGGAALQTMEQSGKINLGITTSLQSLKSAAGSKQASLATVRVLDAIPGANVSAQAARAAAQVTVNPNSRTLFKSVSIREFSFTFKFIPASAREAEEVERIITLFREELYPESIPLDADENVSIGYEFPNKFQIDILYDNKRIGSKILPCFLRDVNVTYNPSNMGMHSDGRFNEIDLTLSFTESRTLDKKQIREGY